MKFVRVLLINLLVIALLILLFEAFFAFDSKATAEKNAFYSERTRKLGDELYKILSPWVLPVEVPMPFFGYGIEHNELSKDQPGKQPKYKINNYKFLSSHNYPYVKEQDEVVIGVFGGSFAFRWVAHETMAGDFAAGLSARIPALKNKKVILLSMSQQGYKEPQQFFTFAYFYEMFDAVLFIDGINEIGLITPSGFPLEFPAYSARFYTMARSEVREELTKNARAHRSFLHNIISVQYKLPWLSKSFLYYTFDSKITDYLQKKIVTLNEQARSGPRIDSFYDKDFMLEEKISRSADIWVKYSVMAHDLAKKNKIKMFHYLQPNQYLNAKPLSEFERKYAFNAQTQPRIELGYKMMVEKFQKAAGKEHHVSTKLMYAFKDEPGDFYIDDCCHINNTGNAVLTKKLLDYMTADWR